jgi:2-polyprenyl-6-methoxyphenol hydroxylase-like FAD-dependent oxidoreductase
MHNHHPGTYDVVIAGAGPVGLLLACELRLADLSVLVLEQAKDPCSPLKRLPFGLRGLSTPTIEAFYRRGLLDDITALQPTKVGGTTAGANWMTKPRSPGGHFAGIQFFHDKIDTARWPWRLSGPATASVAVEMEHLETVLAARAIAMGAEIERDAAVDGFDQIDDDVTVRTSSGIFRGRWLVGCDGGRSTVRKAGGFAFTGTDPEFTGYSVQVVAS